MPFRLLLGGKVFSPLTVLRLYRHLLQTFNKDNVHLETGKIERFTAGGIETSDGEVGLDVVVFATGFDVEKSYRPFRVTGLEGKDLHTEWGDAPAAMNGTVVVNAILKVQYLFRCV